MVRPSPKEVAAGARGLSGIVMPIGAMNQAGLMAPYLLLDRKLAASSSSDWHRGAVERTALDDRLLVIMQGIFSIRL
jgi:hypothetical protein